MTGQAIPIFALFGESAPFPDILHVERIADRAPAHGWTIAPHRHGGLAQVLVIERGAATATVDGAALALADGEFLFVPPHVVHGYAIRPDTVGRVLSLPSALLSGAGITAALGRPVTGRADGMVAALAELLAESFAATGRFRTERLTGLAQALLATLAEAAPQGDAPRRDPRLAGFDALIAAHLADGWRVADYAATLSLSTGHLSRICRAATGLGAKAYLEQAVMAEAARLLAFTRMAVTEVAFRLGYDDPSHFSKRFRAARGVAPSAYRGQAGG
jgi:AraC family transcriptional activator of pobA